MSTLHFVTDSLDPPRAQQPLITARGLTVQTPSGPVFGPLDLDIPGGATVAVIGDPDAGKSSLLLALTGRMHGTRGELRVAGIDGRTHSRRIRKITSVARIDQVIVPEWTLSLDDCITERGLADACPPGSRLPNFLHTAGLMGLDVRRNQMFRQLTPADQTRAAVALATIQPPKVVVLDDLDRGANLRDQEQLWAGLQALAAEGVTVIATTTEPAAVPAGVMTLKLEAHHG